MRKSVTFSSRVFEASTKLKNSEERLEFFDTLFSHFFDNKAINYANIKSEKVSLALAILAPELQKLQTKFDNASKKTKEKLQTSLFLCEKNISEKMQNKAKNSKKNTILNENLPSDYYNNNIKNNSINNQSINHSEKNNYLKNMIMQLINSDCCENSYENLKKENLEDIFKSITAIQSTISTEHKNNLDKIVKHLFKKEIIKINGKIYSSKIVFDKLVGLFCKSDSAEQIQFKFSELEKRENINSKKSYYIASFFNLAEELSNRDKILESQKSSSHYGTFTNNYTNSNPSSNGKNTNISGSNSQITTNFYSQLSRFPKKNISFNGTQHNYKNLSIIYDNIDNTEI